MLARYFTFYPVEFTGYGGSMYITATVDEMEYTFATSLHLRQPQLGMGFTATFPGATIKTITGLVSFVQPCCACSLIALVCYI
jgi:hypothetical protein